MATYHQKVSVMVICNKTGNIQRHYMTASGHFLSFKLCTLCTNVTHWHRFQC